MEQIQKALQIRYVKLHFHLRFIEDTILPKNKASALRGGMGEMLLRANCIRDRNCPGCDFASECIVRRTMYSQLAIQPDFMHEGDSVGYVIECEDHDEEFLAGEQLEFRLILFGKNIVYFNQYLQAFAYLGMEGLGKHKSKFVVDCVTNTNRELLVEGSQVYKRDYKIRTVADYVQYRMRTKKQEDTLVLHTPLSVKYRGKMLEEIDMEAVMAAVIRRIYILDCFEGIEMDRASYAGHVPELVSQDVRRASVRRYSSTHDGKIDLNGIRGSAQLARLDETARMLLYAGELVHIGKNTSFGFGRYSLTENTNRANNFKEDKYEAFNDT